MGNGQSGHGGITVILTPEGVEAIAEAVVRKLREEGVRGLNPERCLLVNGRIQETKVASVPQEQEPSGPRMYRPLMTAAETVEYLKEQGIEYKIGSLANLRKSGGGIPYRKFGIKVRYHRDDVDAWVFAFHTKGSTSERDKKR